MIIYALFSLVLILTATSVFFTYRVYKGFRQQNMYIYNSIKSLNPEAKPPNPPNMAPIIPLHVKRKARVYDTKNDIDARMSGKHDDMFD